MLKYIWETYLEKCSQITLSIVIPYLIFIASYYSFGTLFFLFEKFELFQNRKLQPKTHLTNEQVLKIVKHVTWQIIFVYPIGLGLTYPIISWRISKDLDDLPSSPFDFFKEAFVFLILAEIWFYYLHVLMHQGWFYQNIHKLHHEFTAPIVFEVS